MSPQRIFIDMQGHYLGEIVLDNGLLANHYLPHRRVNYGNYGNAGNYGHMFKVGPILLPPRWADVDRMQLGHLMPR